MATGVEDPSLRRERFIKLVRLNLHEDSVDDSTDPMPSDLDFNRRIADRFMQTVEKLSQKWSYLGLTRRCREERREELMEMCEDLERTEDECIEYAENEMKIMEANVKNLTQELELDDWQPPQGTLMFILNKLLDKQDELQEMKKERVSKWLELSQELKLLEEKLGLPVNPNRMVCSRVPNERNIQDLQSTVLGTRKDYARKQRVYTHARMQILNLAKSLEISSESREVIQYTGHDGQRVVLSEVFLRDQDAYMRSLEKLLEGNRKTKELLLSRLDELWDKLDTSQDERDQELDGIVNETPSELEKLKKIVEKYEELRRQNLGKFIDKIRGEVIEYWEKCYVSKEDKDNFEVYMNAEDYNEPLLTAFEEELSRWKNYYQENEAIFRALEGWQSCWVKYRDLEKKNKDPSRFNNRGGVLLKQEKEMKRVQKELIKHEKEIQVLAEKWSAAHNNQLFMVEDQLITDFIKKQKLYYQEYEENEKKEKQRYRKDLENREAKLLKGNSRLTPNVIQRTPVKLSANNTPASGFGSTDMKNRFYPNKPLSPLNREMKMTRNRTRMMNKGSENRTGSVNKSSRTNGHSSIKTKPHTDIVITSCNGKTPVLDKLVREDIFRALLKDGKHETFESTVLSKKSGENSMNITFRKDQARDASKITSGYGTLDRRKSKSQNLVSTLYTAENKESPYHRGTPHLKRCDSLRSVKSNKSSIFSPRPFLP